MLVQISIVIHILILDKRYALKRKAHCYLAENAQSQDDHSGNSEGICLASEFPQVLDKGAAKEDKDKSRQKIEAEDH